MVSTEELEVLHALGQAGGEVHFQVLKRIVLPYRPRAIEEMCWGLGQSGYLELLPYKGLVKLTEKGEQLLQRGYYYWKELEKNRGKTKTVARRREGALSKDQSSKG